MVKLIRVDDDNASEAELQTYVTVVEVAHRYGVDPSMSVEAEEFFIQLLQQYNGPDEELVSWLEEQIQHHFVILVEQPRWIQSPAWPFANNRPMLFVGQIDVSRGQGVASQIFHDDTSFYVFIPAEGPPVVVMQQY